MTPAILAWSAEQEQIVPTHHVVTMIGFAYERIQAGLAMPGLFEVSRRVSAALAIEKFP